ncbi:hypothetical protein [Myroides sp. N17-2]|uniref:hypothetical protein n=1 Tax=Myroides sp. N17-2 TaxID=2030799 RepID=UPI000EFD15A3|nr:hypothetical protein [Myroides sp. N17-2]
MNYKIEEVELNDSLSKLSITPLTELAFVPENLDSVNDVNEFIYTETVIELNKYFENRNIKIQTLGGEPQLLRSRKNADIYLPSIFMTSSIILDNANTLSVILNIISNYIYDNIKGKIGVKKAQIEFIIEKKERGKYSKIDYKGDAEGLKQLEKIIKSL